MCLTLSDRSQLVTVLTVFLLLKSKKSTSVRTFHLFRPPDRRYGGSRDSMSAVMYLPRLYAGPGQRWVCPCRRTGHSEPDRCSVIEICVHWNQFLRGCLQAEWDLYWSTETAWKFSRRAKSYVDGQRSTA